MPNCIRESNRLATTGTLNLDGIVNIIYPWATIDKRATIRIATDK